MTGFAARGLDWIVGAIAPRGTEMILDVAYGAAYLGQALAPHVCALQALDLVPEMLEQAHRLAMAAGLTNLALLQGEATALPWIDSQFDIVGCRLTLHQVGNPAAVVAQMVRVARPGAQIVVVDMVVDPDPAVAEQINRLERLRDPSHGRALTQAEVVGLLTDCGAAVETTSTKPQPLDLEDWMSRTQTPPLAREQIRRELREELRGGAVTGLDPFVDGDGTIKLLHTWLTAIARKLGTSSPG